MSLVQVLFAKIRNLEQTKAISVGHSPEICMTDLVSLAQVPKPTCSIELHWHSSKSYLGLPIPSVH